MTAEIVIADEHPIFRHGLRRMLETQPGLSIVGETGDALELATTDDQDPAGGPSSNDPRS